MSDTVTDIFGRDRPLVDRPKLHIDMERSCAKLQGAFPGNMAGYLVFAAGEDGFWSLGFHVRDDTPMGARMMAGLAMIAIQEELVNIPTCRRVIDGSEG